MTTPDGDPIETHTLWLSFGDEGEIAISADVTKFNAAMRNLQATVARTRPMTDPCGGATIGGSGCTCPPPF